MRTLAALAIVAATLTPSGAVADPACSFTVCADATVDATGSECGTDENGRFACRIVANGTGNASSIYGADPVWTPGIMNVTVSIDSCRWTRGAMTGGCGELIGPATVVTRWGGLLLTSGATATAGMTTPSFPVPAGPGPCTTIEWVASVRIDARTEVQPVREGFRRQVDRGFAMSICSD